MAEGFRFSSPYDDAIDRRAYFERCWTMGPEKRPPEPTAMAGAGDDWFVRYDVPLASGGGFTNVEHFVIRGGRIESIRVFFGAPARGHDA